MPTGWILREMKLADLKNHPVDAEIYGEHSLDDELLSSIKANGILDPLVATKDGVILSGHRRKAHGIKAGLKTANVLCARHAMSDDEQIVSIVESNRYREKSTEQKAREFGKLAEAMAALARKRQAHGKTAPGKALPANLPEVSNGEAKEQAAAEVGMSRRTAERALEVAQKIDQAIAAGDKKQAEELRKTLNEKSVAAAHRQATREPGEDAPDPSHDETIADQMKVLVPKKLRAVFVHVKTFRGIINRIGKLRSDIEELQRSDAGAAITINEVLKSISHVQEAMKFAVPYTECPKCRRGKEECKTCDSLRWITEGTFKRCRTEEGEAWLKNR